MHQVLSTSLLAALLAAGCTRDAAPQAAIGGRAFELSCTGSSTHTSGSMQCVRHDTRNGDVQRVDLGKLPTSNGSTSSATLGPAGLFQLACAAVNMAERSDFACVRLNTQTGELMLINLMKVGQVPSS
ncbi:MAG TPA: hypothetical protein VM513_27525 [Kofleriaceae bacterium]|jgi:hypothetical protein|nr:hypothetical protein [Kofleriaceae bacterium]